MDRRRLECFIALAEELHFSRAAQRAGISQPGLSQQLRQLESQLQVQLVSRNKRHVALTRAGDVFLAQARKIVADMSAAVALSTPRCIPGCSSRSRSRWRFARPARSRASARLR